MQRLFRDDAPLKYQAITGYLYSEENVDDSTSLDYGVVLDIVDDTTSESSTSRFVELLFLYVVATYKKAQTAEKFRPQKIAALAGYVEAFLSR